MVGILHLEVLLGAALVIAALAQVTRGRGMAKPLISPILQPG